jgi:hypothetical protein
MTAEDVAAFGGIARQLYHKTIPGDGNCFYSSLYTSLNERPEAMRRVCRELRIPFPVTNIDFIRSCRTYLHRSPEYKKSLGEEYDLYAGMINGPEDIRESLEFIRTTTTRDRFDALNIRFEETRDLKRIFTTVRTKGDQPAGTAIGTIGLSLNYREDNEASFTAAAVSGNLYNMDGPISDNFLQNIKKALSTKEEYIILMQDNVLRDGSWATGLEITFLKTLLERANIDICNINNIQANTQYLISDTHHDIIYLVHNIAANNHFDSAVLTGPGSGGRRHIQKTRKGRKANKRKNTRRRLKK